ncbi:MAG: ABC transporter permease [Candidatus Aminicenantes bacterium]|nr:MAG: ABC transporter permease [Candidatus Aminicenantes bacterium]
MLKNYIKTAVRNLLKRKGYSLINIVGLAIGMASCLLILMFVNDELSYDTFNEKADRIHRVAGSFFWGGRSFDIAVAPAPAAQVLIDEFPEVENAVRFRQRGRYVFRYGDNTYREMRVSYVDSSFFEIFSIPLLKGNPATALLDPNTLILSRNTAHKYFGDENPVGKTLRLNDQTDYMVTGVFEEIPGNSHFHFDVFISMESLRESKSKTWMSQNFQTYILLHEGADPAAVEAKFPAMLIKYMGPQIEAFLGKSMEKLVEENELSGEFYLQPLRDIHLHSDLIAEMEATSDIKYVYIFTVIALFILIIASINYLNLSTARSAGRAREVGIRKVLGSFRSQLMRQFLMESMMLCLVSLVIALGLVRLALPFFNGLSGKVLSLSALGNSTMLGVLVLVAIFVGILAGSYSAFLLSAFQPVNVLKGQLKSEAKTGWLRSGLVIFQFAASIILIIGTFVVYNQLHYIQNKKLGYNKEQVIIMNNTYLLGDQSETFKNQMLAFPQIVKASVSDYLPVPSNNNNSAVLPDGDRDSKLATSMQNWIVDYDYITTLGMKIVDGRDFSREFSTDTKATIINQAAAKQFDWAQPVGRRIGRIVSNQGDMELYEVIGVVEDFHFETLKETIGPLVMFLGNSNGNISFRVETEDISGTIGLLQKEWKKFLPHQPFEYSFLDDRFAGMYQTEQRIGRIFGVFAGFAIFIGCLGLFALAAFTAEQRTKEIGIRKVLGATAPNIIRLLTKEFVILIAVANVIAWPVAFLVMKGWLKDFSYRIPLNVWVFIGAGLLTLFIALLTVSFQAIKAALADPANSLRYE